MRSNGRNNNVPFFYFFLSPRDTSRAARELVQRRRRGGSGGNGGVYEKLRLHFYLPRAAAAGVVTVLVAPRQLFMKCVKS